MEAAGGFLHSYRWPEHERRATARLREALPGLYVVASHQLSQEYREFERTSTTAASAYVGPLVSGYLGELERRLGEQGMGGTTAKACVIRRGRPNLASDYFIGGYEEGLAIRIPILGIVEIGTGGGSVGRVDEGGSLHVSPRSAGAELVLDAAAAEGAIRSRLAEPLGLEPVRVAWGMLEIATAAMANAVRSVTTQRGLDPRDFTLVAYGGGGSVRAVAVARGPHLPRVVVPRAPATFAALGMLLADRVTTTSRPCSPAWIGSPWRRWRPPSGPLRWRSWRRWGQRPSTRSRCATSERRTYATWTRSVRSRSPSPPGRSTREPAELVSIRLSAVVAGVKPRFPHLRPGGATPAASAMVGERAVTFDPGRGPTICPRYWREALLAGNLIRGPALIEAPSTVTVVPPGARLTVDGSGHLIVDREAVPGGRG